MSVQQARFEAEQNNPLIVEENMDEVSFLRNENQALKEANTLLEQKIKQTSVQVINSFVHALNGGQFPPEINP
jgi:hypothetical protein